MLSVAISGGQLCQVYLLQGAVGNSGFGRERRRMAVPNPCEITCSDAPPAFESAGTSRLVANRIIYAVTLTDTELGNGHPAMFQSAPMIINVDAAGN